MNQLRVSHYPWYCLCQIYAMYYSKFIHLIYSMYIYGMDTPKRRANILIYSNNSLPLSLRAGEDGSTFATAQNLNILFKHTLCSIRIQ